MWQGEPQTNTSQRQSMRPDQSFSALPWGCSLRRPGANEKGSIFIFYISGFCINSSLEKGFHCLEESLKTSNLN